MTEKKYRFLKHTADAKFQAFGKTLEEAIGNTALALASLMWEWKTIEKKIKRPIEVKGKDLKQLLVVCLLYTSPSPRDRTRSRMPSSA